MKRHKYIFPLMLILIFAIGCREDSILVIEEETELPVSDEVTYQFLVTNEQGDPISDAQLLINTDIYTTDENGVAITQPQSVSSLGLSLKVTASEYESIMKRVEGAEGAKINEKIVLFKAVNTIIPAGGSGFVDGGGKLTLPTNFRASDGSVYSGDVTVKSKYLDPDNKDFLRSAPGNLLALNTADEYQLLASLGMYMIELYDDNGGELELRDGSLAIIEFPIADRHKSNIGGEIPLWYFDEIKGVWIEDGVATVDGDVMVAEVNHFTWWNCDLPYDFTLVCLTFLDGDGEQMPGLEVEFSVNGVSFGVATTDLNGNIIAKVPVGLIFDMTYYLEGEIVGTQSTGPFEVGARKEIINTNLNPVVIFGVAIDCDGNSIMNGYAYYQSLSGLKSIQLDSDGSFIYYGPGVEHLLVLVDINSNKIHEVTISEADQLADLNLGDIIVCGEEIATKVSGYVMLDTDKDNIGDTPLGLALIALENTSDQSIKLVNTDLNGYYESDLLPGIQYNLLLTSVDEYELIAAGDNTPDGDVQNNEFDFGNRRGHVIAMQDEHDSDNDFLVIPSGLGTVSGTVMADTNGDGEGDSPAEWIDIYMSWPLHNKYILVDSDGSFSSTVDAGYYVMIMIDLLFEDYNMISNIDISPDPDGDEIIPGSSHAIPLVLQKDELDSGNTFVVDHSQEKTFLCRVLEDTDGDGIGDVPVPNVDISIVLKNAGLVLQPQTTNEFGVAEFFRLNMDNEYTFAVHNSSLYEVINIIDTSPDNDPFIVDGDVTKMEIFLEEGEWDAGNIFVVRKI